MNYPNTLTPSDNDEYVKRILNTVLKIKEDEEMSWADLAEKCGIPKGTVSQVVGGSYRGDLKKYLIMLDNWMANRDAAANVKAHVLEEPGYIDTPSKKAIYQVLNFAQAMPDIVAIASAPGLGKTETVRKYKKYNPNVWVLTASPSMRTVTQMLRCLGDVMNIQDVVSTELDAAIREVVSGTDGLIMIDEAQHLSLEALEQLRSYHDLEEGGVGLAFIGNLDVYGRLEGKSRGVGFAQLFSRIGMRITQSKLKVGDADAVIDAWGVTDKDTRKILKSISTKPGALRLMCKSLKLASIIAAGARSLVVEAVHVKTAYEQLSTSR